MPSLYLLVFPGILKHTGFPDAQNPQKIDGVWNFIEIRSCTCIDIVVAIVINEDS